MIRTVAFAALSLAVVLGEASDPLGGEVNAVPGADNGLRINRICDAHTRAKGFFEDRLWIS